MHDLPLTNEPKCLKGRFFHLFDYAWVFQRDILLGLQQYTGALVNRDIFCRDTNIDI